jgi:hypothetical protein
VRRALVLAACIVVAAAVGVESARATNECRGLMVCIPVAGPWVVVPAAGRRAEWQLTCPRGTIVGGLDAELSARAIDVSFRGRLGSPVNPGITTERSALVAGHYTGRTRQATTFRPHVGCVPASGGGGSPPPYITALRLAGPEAFPPGRPTVRRVRTAPLGAGSRQVGVACGPNERLVSASHAIGFHTQVTPAAAIVAAVRSSRVVRGRRVLVRVNVARVARNANAVVQVHAVCAGAGR